MRERDRQTDTDRDRDTERHRETGRQRQTGRKREREKRHSDRSPWENKRENAEALRKIQGGRGRVTEALGKIQGGRGGVTETLGKTRGKHQSPRFPQGENTEPLGENQSLWRENNGGNRLPLEGEKNHQNGGNVTFKSSSMDPPPTRMTGSGSSLTRTLSMASSTISRMRRRAAVTSSLGTWETRAVSPRSVCGHQESWLASALPNTRAFWVATHQHRETA